MALTLRKKTPAILPQAEDGTAEKIWMDPTGSLPADTFWQENSFGFIKPDEYKVLGIDPSDIPMGTFAALKHPSSGLLTPRKLK